MSKTALIPTSKAKTAYGLLSEIAALTDAEPKRMRMCSWGGVQGNAKDWGAQAPACGTVGCIGGWTNILKPRGGSADAVLGLTADQTGELFYGPLCYATEQPGTRRHANRVIALIRRFQKKYAAQLKAKRV